MNKKIVLGLGLSCVISAGFTQAQESKEQPEMSFFVTSVGMGKGGDLGGLAGADSHCQSLAEAAGSKGKTWKAYLSTQAKDGKAAINARDRIGEGPWVNANGIVMGENLEVVHYSNANFNYNGSRNEYGATINSRGMGNSPNMHDILTGSNMDGTASTSSDDATCNNWTSSDAGAAIVGHHDRFRFTTPGSSWNSVHKTKGCSLDDLKATGGQGLFYCFAAD